MDADRQWRAVSEAIEGVRTRFFPDIPGLVLHATELWSGGSTLKREVYDRELRHEALRSLVELVNQFNLTVVLGFEERSVVSAAYPSLPARESTYGSHAIAFGCAVRIAERWLRSFSDLQSVAALVVEDNDQARRHLRETMVTLRQDIWEGSVNDLSDVLPLRQIVGNPHFETKDSQSLLQLADALSFVAKRHLQGSEGSKAFYDVIRDRVIAEARSELVKLIM